MGSPGLTRSPGLTVGITSALPAIVNSNNAAPTIVITELPNLLMAAAR